MTGSLGPAGSIRSRPTLSATPRCGCPTASIRSGSIGNLRWPPTSASTDCASSCRSSSGSTISSTATIPLITRRNSTCSGGPSNPATPRPGEATERLAFSQHHEAKPRHHCAHRRFRPGKWRRKASCPNLGRMLQEFLEKPFPSRSSHKIPLSALPFTGPYPASRLGFGTKQTAVIIPQNHSTNKQP